MLILLAADAGLGIVASGVTAAATEPDATFCLLDNRARKENF